MDNVSKTMYIPLYGKAYVSRKGIILSDKKAEEIWYSEGFALKGRSRSKWLAYFLAMRAAVFDSFLSQEMDKNKDAVVLHIGCGMDSRICRVGTKGHLWYDIDLEAVIGQRKKYYQPDEFYRMIPGDAAETGWIKELPQGRDIIMILEGIGMYLSAEKLRQLMRRVSEISRSVLMLMDCYTERGAKATKHKNPINDVGVTEAYGIDDPLILEKDTGFRFAGEHEMTPSELVNELKGAERRFFSTMFAGKLSKSLYRMYEYRYS